MARVKNTMELIQRSVGHVNTRYDLHFDNVNDIINGSANQFDLIVNGFRFGYMQGMKAAQAERRKQE